MDCKLIDMRLDTLGWITVAKDQFHKIHTFCWNDKIFHLMAMPDPENEAPYAVFRQSDNTAHLITDANVRDHR